MIFYITKLFLQISNYTLALIHLNTNDMINIIILHAISITNMLWNHNIS